MANNQSINIGGVRFNSQDIKKSEVIKQDGKEMNSVFLNDGTHIVFPNQDAKNDASIMQQNGHKSVPRENSHYNRSLQFYDIVEDPSFKETTFNKLDNAQITGTDGKDDYRLRGCKDTSVDISQDDGVEDKVSVRKFKAEDGEKRYSSGVNVDSKYPDRVSIRQKKD